MNADSPGIDVRLQAVERALAAMERRITALEAAARAPAVGASETLEPGAPAWAEPTPGGEPRDLAGVLPLLGRTFIALGGAFLLRALTDSGRLPLQAGVALGLAYAVGWLVVVGRAASAGRPLSASFHALAGLAIGLPVLWEASTRFALLPPAASAMAIGVFSGLALLVSWRGRVHSLAAMATVATIVTAVALVARTGAIAPYGALLVALGLATLWLGYERDWFWLRWPSALAANLVLAGLTTRALSPATQEPSGPVLAVLLFLLAGYLASFAARTLVRGRLVIPFEVVQTLAVLAVGLGGAVAVAHRSGSGEGPLGLATTLLGVGAYGAGFAFVGRRQGLGSNFYFYATLALLLVVTGLAILLPRMPFALACSALAVLTTWLAARFSREALALHGAVYVALAAGASGLLGGTLSAFSSDGPGWPVLGPAAWAALASALTCLVLPRPARSDAPDALTRLPRIAVGLIVAAGSAAAILLPLQPVVSGVTPAAGTIATLRTAVIAAAAVLLALATRHERVKELGWWMYPVLAAGGLKLVVEDFHRSEPAALFVALALLGAALVAAPRLARRAGLAVPLPSEGPDGAGPLAG